MNRLPSTWRAALAAAGLLAAATLAPGCAGYDVGGQWMQPSDSEHWTDPHRTPPTSPPTPPRLPTRRRACRDAWQAHQAAAQRGRLGR